MSAFKWVVFDLDGTLTRTSTMAFVATRAGYGQLAARLTADYEAGRATNSEVSHAYAEVLHNILQQDSEARLREMLEDVDTFDGISDVVGGLQRRGVRCGLATVTFDFIAHYFSERFGFDCCWATVLKRDAAGRLTGHLETVSESADKLRALRDHFSAARTGLREIAYVGDGRSDVDIMENVGLSIAFNASDAARSVACLDVTASSLTSIFAPEHPFRCTDRPQRTCAHTDEQPWMVLDDAPNDASVEART